LTDSSESSALVKVHADQDGADVVREGALHVVSAVARVVA